MTHTISGDYSQLIKLSGTADNPTTITSSGGLNGGLYADSLGSPWTITNAGRVLGTGLGLQSSGTVVNTGDIDGNNAVGVLLVAGGSVTNQSGGVIHGRYGISAGAAATVVNSGNIEGSYSSVLDFGVGVDLGSVTNASGGKITGFVGVTDATTVVNAGRINGSKYALELASGFTGLLVLDPGAAFSGTVSGGNAIGTMRVSSLELASGATAGTLSGLGTEYIDFARIVVDADANWRLTGANTIAAGVDLTNGGTLTSSGTLTNDGGIYGAAGAAGSSTHSFNATGGVGGAGVGGVSLAGGVLSNAGLIRGGAGGTGGSSELAMAVAAAPAPPASR